jgi:hypothetical protein
LLLAVVASGFAGSPASAVEICHGATVGQARTMIKFCVDPENGRVTNQSAGGAWIMSREQKTTAASIDGSMTLNVRRSDPPLRITSRYLLKDAIDSDAPFGKKGQAAYQMCNWNFVSQDCAQQDPARAAPRCWTRCSNWYLYMPGQEIQ